MTDKQLSAEDDRGWPDRDYWCTCAECQCRFTGHKRQKVCRVCSELNASSHPQPECGGVDDLDAIAWRVSHPVHGWKSYDQKPDWADGDYSLHVQPLCRLSDAQRQIAEQQRLLAERDARIEALTEYAAAVERSADKAEQERDQLRALLTAQPQASAAQSAPATVATGNMRAVLAMVLQALDRDAAEGRSLRGEMAAELRAAMEAQSAPAGEREALMPTPDEIHQMAFEEGQPAENGDGYLFCAEEFDCFVQRLLDSCAAWQRTQSAGVPDVSAMARVLSDRSADACNIDRTDNWAMYGQEYIEDVQAMLAAPAQPAAQDQGEMQRLREALEGMLEYFPEGASDGECFAVDAARAALAASTGQEVEP